MLNYLQIKHEKNYKKSTKINGKKNVNVKLINSRRKEWIRNKTHLKDVRKEVEKLICKFSGYNMRQKEDRWN